MHGSDWVDIFGEVFGRSLRPALVLATTWFLAFTEWGHRLVNWYVLDKAAGITETWMPAFQSIASSATA